MARWNSRWRSFTSTKRVELHTRIKIVTSNRVWPGGTPSWTTPCVGFLELFPLRRLLSSCKMVFNESPCVWEFVYNLLKDLRWQGVPSLQTWGSGVVDISVQLLLFSWFSNVTALGNDCWKRLLYGTDNSLISSTFATLLIVFRCVQRCIQEEVSLIFTLQS